MSLMDSLTSILIGVAIESWEIFLEAAPYLFLGFGVAGLLHILVPDERIMDILGESAGKVRSVINAAIAGIPLPLCSCGVIPAAISLKKRGATRGAALSFLISTPETGVDSIAITYALLDPLMTVFRPIATFITAVTAGTMDNFFAKKEESRTLKTLSMATGSEGFSCSCSSCVTPSEGESPLRKVHQAARYAYVELLGDISKWLIVGIILAGIISYAIPENLIGTYLGGGITSMFLMLLIGIPLYICATASTPLAATLISKGMSPGTAFVFLLAGPATNAATITMVTKFLGKRTAVIYLTVISLCSIGFGLILDLIYFRMGVEVTSIVGSTSETLPQGVKTAFALLMIPLIAYSLYRARCEG